MTQSLKNFMQDQAEYHWIWLTKGLQGITDMLNQYSDKENAPRLPGAAATEIENAILILKNIIKKHG